MDTVLFVVLPYVALGLAIFGGLYRYWANPFSYSSLSSQVLENRELLWGSVPWHYGIIPILLAHLFAGVLPGVALGILHPRPSVLVLELIGLALALFALLGIVILFLRRVGRRSRVRPVTSTMDWILLVLLAVQVLTGVAMPLFLRWGALWYPYTASPWFWSLVTFAPDAGTVTALPAAAKLHMLNGFVIIGLFPFTRLVHIVAIPVQYLWRPYQVVIWNRAHRPRRRAA